MVRSRATTLAGEARVFGARRRTLHPRVLRHQLLPVALAAQPVDRGDIRQGAGFQDVGAEAAAADLSAIGFQLNMRFAQRFLSLGDRADAVIG